MAISSASPFPVSHSKSPVPHQITHDPLHTLSYALPVVRLQDLACNIALVMIVTYSDKESIQDFGRGVKGVFCLQSDELIRGSL